MINLVQAIQPNGRAFKQCHRSQQKLRVRVLSAVLVSLVCGVCSSSHSYATTTQPEPPHTHQLIESAVSADQGDRSDSQTIDINGASVLDLATLLPGIGPEKAQRIVDWRRANGAFQFKQQLLQVSGIGSKTLERIADFFHIGNGKNPYSKSQLSAPATNQKPSVLSNIVTQANEDAQRASAEAAN